ncbi:roadblock/LC7 domain-containing protein [Actinocorallia sp. API 0066]|uniref:roadblock/LC7 domain-containing protein n=1 Tax=Actinocorallia sp. API 0066 TaxID=2896846 RepID=UPI001E62F260|nr:roadblock/LC7 domain-containing protein [Actinocorallia sp. API 0066]MCD0449607.1 roadblock/LC7 domain-containing protein [Actinocorallia sp. API 0066]
MTGTSRPLGHAGADLGFMIDDFARVPGVRHVVLLSMDGLAMLWSSGLERDTAERLAALTCSALGTGRALAKEVGERDERGGQMICQFPSGGHFVVGAVSVTAGIGVAVEPGASLPSVVNELQRLIGAVGARLAPSPLMTGGGIL